MKIPKAVNKRLMLLLLLILIVSTEIFIFTYINDNKGELIGNTVERTRIDNVVEIDNSKKIQTVEINNEKNLTQIGKRKLIVNSYYDDYITKSEQNKFTIMDPGSSIKETWVSVKPKKEYTIGVLLPHFEDKYWITANYGIINYAKELGVKIKLYSVGGYIEFGNQKSQLKALAKDDKVDGIIFAALDSTKFDSDIANIVDSEKPVVELINNINTSKISAKAIVSYYEMGYKAGEFVVKDSAGKDLKIAFFPGPEESGWAPDTLNGFNDAILKLKKENQKIRISQPFYGDTRPNVQRLRVKSVLEKNNDYDYLVGCAPAVVEAEKFIAENKEKFQNIKIVSTYMTDEVYNLIGQGTVQASPSDQTIEQCRIALDMIVKILNGEKPGKDFPFESGPEIPIISKDNISQFKYEDLFGAKDYIPVLNHVN